MIYIYIIYIQIILLAGDVSINPGPQPNLASTVPNDFDFPTKRGLRISHLNVRSIIHKMDSIRLMLKNKPFDIFSVSETWLNSDILDSELAIDGYSFIRQDRLDRKGGGCMVYVRENLPYCIRPELQVREYRILRYRNKPSQVQNHFPLDCL